MSSIVAYPSLPIPIPYGAEILNLVPIILAVVGVLAVGYSLIRWKTPGTTTNLENLVGFVTFVIGLLLPIGAALCFLNGAYGAFTIILLLLLSVAFVLGPISRIMKKIPTLGIAAIIALVAAFLIASFITAAVPPAVQAFLASKGLNQWILVILFVVIIALLFSILVFARGLIELFGMVFGSWPIMMILGAVCVLQGILLVFGLSLTQIFEGGISVPW